MLRLLLCCADVNGFVLASFSSPKWAILVANIAILIHVLTAFQIFAQAMFDTLESHIKWFMLQRAARKVAAPTLTVPLTAAADADDAALSKLTQAVPAPSPFDAPSAEAGGPAFGAARRSSVMGYARSSLAPLEERMSSSLSAAISSRASSMVPPLPGEHPGAAAKAQAGPLARLTPRRISAPPSMPMYELDTGLANEEVSLVFVPQLSKAYHLHCATDLLSM